MNKECSNCGEEMDNVICPCIFQIIDFDVFSWIENPVDKLTVIKKCTCGGAKANTTHSDWCDIKERL